MLEWIIVGGGVHGTALAFAILTRTGIGRNDLLVVDPHRSPLFEWRRTTRSCGMKYLRSPGSHSLDPSFAGLRRWATRRGIGGEHFLPPYSRPSLQVFDEHADWFIERHGLARLRTQDRVAAIQPMRNGVEVVCESGARHAAKRAILATGKSDVLNAPDWAAVDDARSRHVFGPPFTAVREWARGRTVVVGGGISAAQTALSLTEVTSVDSVTIVTRHAPRVTLFDSEPCYIGPRCLPEFLSVSNLRMRRRLLQRARNPGSMPPYVANELLGAVEDGQISLVVCEVEAANYDDVIRLSLADRGVLEADSVVFATGFASRLPGRELVTAIARDFSLPTDDAGFPVPDLDLGWRKDGDARIYATGPLGELVLGPSAGNIIGAQTAGRRIVAGLRREVRTIEDIPWTWGEALA